MQARSRNHNHPFTVAQSLSSIRYRAFIVMQTLSSSHCHVDIIIHQPSCIHCHAFTVLHLLSRNRRLICKSHNSYHPYTFMHHPFHTYHDYHALYYQAFTIVLSSIDYGPLTIQAIVLNRLSFVHFHAIPTIETLSNIHYYANTSIHSLSIMQSLLCKKYHALTIIIPYLAITIHYPSCSNHRAIYYECIHRRAFTIICTLSRNHYLAIEIIH